MIAFQKGQLPRAGRLFGAAEALRDRIQADMTAYERMEYDALVGQLKSMTPPDELETTWQESKPVNSNNLAGDTTGIGQFTHVMLIQVDDAGPGISPEDMPKIFDPFFTTQTGGEGTGLGLYLVEEIINEHRGVVEVKNRPEGGARFSIWLPLEQASTSEQEPT